MTEVTDEMVQLALDVFLATPTDSIAQIDAGMGKALAAVLAIVERDQAGPCQAELNILVNGPATPCQLRHGHLGDHVSGVTRWRERSEPAARWRCNTTERCFREDGHAGRHGFAGQEPRAVSSNQGGAS